MPPSSFMYATTVVLSVATRTTWPQQRGSNSLRANKTEFSSRKFKCSLLSGIVAWMCAPTFVWCVCKIWTAWQGVAGVGLAGYIPPLTNKSGVDEGTLELGWPSPAIPEYANGSSGAPVFPSLWEGLSKTWVVSRSKLSWIGGSWFWRSHLSTSPGWAWLLLEPSRTGSPLSWKPVLAPALISWNSPPNLTPNKKPEGSGCPGNMSPCLLPGLSHELYLLHNNGKLHGSLRETKQESPKRES